MTEYKRSCCSQENPEENKAVHKTAKQVEKTVAIAKARPRAYDRLYADMDTTEGQNEVIEDGERKGKELERHISQRW